MNRLAPSSFGTIIDDIEYQKSYLFRIGLPDVDTKQYMGKLRPNNEMFEFCTSSTALPAMTTAVQTIPYYNSELKILTKTTYSNWNVNFRLDLNRKTVRTTDSMMNTWEYLYCWQLMAHWPYSHTSALPNEYKQPIELYLLNENADGERPASHYQLQGACPVSISGGNLDYGTDSIVTFTVDFAFDRFIVMDF